MPGFGTPTAHRKGNHVFPVEVCLSDRLCLPEFVQRPPWWGGMLQTIRTRFFPLPDYALDRFPRRGFEIPLGDDSGDRLTGQLIRPADNALPGRPLVVLLHGLGGTSQSVYMRSCADFLCGKGYRVACLNFRGCGDSGRRCTEIHHPGRTEDLVALLEALRQDDWSRKELSDGVVLVGFSLGGSVLLNFLANPSVSERVLGAVTISAPLDLKSTSSTLNRLSRWPLQYYLLRRMKSEILDRETDLREDERRAVRRAESVWAFDKTFTAPRCDYQDVESYYEQNSAGTRLNEIQTPTLLLFSLDDPVVDGDQYRRVEWSSNPRLIPAIVDHGGHVGFHARPGTLPEGAQRWHESCILEFVESLGAGRMPEHERCGSSESLFDPRELEPLESRIP